MKVQDAIDAADRYCRQKQWEPSGLLLIEVALLYMLQDLTETLQNDDRG